MTKPKVYTTTFASVYPLYIQKAERRNQAQVEIDEIIYWSTGYNEKGLQQQLTQKVTMEAFFGEAPNFNESAQLIRGVTCGYRVEEIGDPLIQKICHLDKLIGELAGRKAMEKILRT